MLAYVDLIQKKEKAIGCDVFTHQKWSGASYSDRVLNGELACLALFRYPGAAADGRCLHAIAVAAGSSATAAGGKDSTEHSF